MTATLCRCGIVACPGGAECFLNIAVIRLQAELNSPALAKMMTTATAPKAPGDIPGLRGLSQREIDARKPRIVAECRPAVCSVCGKTH